MSDMNAMNVRPMIAPGAETDGRRRRSEASRDRIIAAMLALVEAGEISPSAEAVAARAEVGLRSVFRHFKDMESLYRELSLQLAKYYVDAFQSFVAQDWRGQLDELVDRRLTVYERLMPFKRAADAHRHESPALQEDYARLTAVIRARLRGLLPAEIAGDTLRFEALDLVLSFDSWLRLRLAQNLPEPVARQVVETQVVRLLAE